MGAAHGICSILHMILESPLFSGSLQKLNQKQQLVKGTIDVFLQMQSADGNFPTVLEDAEKSEHKLVHWCHGAPGAVYLFAKAYIIFNELKYLNSCLLAGDLVWTKGLLLDYYAKDLAHVMVLLEMDMCFFFYTVSQMIPNTSTEPRSLQTS